ncbi:hypothetical protein ACQX0S_06780 [Corynebacterium diphtheriae]
MFKRSLASLAAVAVVSGAVVAPANAVTVTVNDGMCTISLTTEEANFIRLTSPLTLSKERAAFFKTQYGEPQLPALRAEIEKVKKELAEPELNAARRAKLTSELNEKRKQLTVYQNFKDALNACINGQNYNSDQPGGPKRPDDSSKPGGSKHPDGSDQPGGPKRPDDSSKPGGSKHPDGSDQPGGPNNPDGSDQPDGKRALPSINGAVIGAIVAVLGILVAALPFIKSMLPAQLRALLP